ARRIQTGETVAVHLLIGASIEPQTLINKVRNLTGPARKELLEFGEHEGTPYVVTTEWKRTVAFPEWVSAVTPTGSDRFAKAGNWRIPVSEFGRKMEPGVGTPAPPEPQTPPIPSDPQPPEPDPPAPVGEFTRMFEAAQRNEPDFQPPSGEPGGFTRMFEAHNPANRSAHSSIGKPDPNDVMQTFHPQSASDLAETVKIPAAKPLVSNPETPKPE